MLQAVFLTVDEEALDLALDGAGHPRVQCQSACGLPAFPFSRFVLMRDPKPK